MRLHLLPTLSLCVILCGTQLYSMQSKSMPTSPTSPKAPSAFQGMTSEPSSPTEALFKALFKNDTNYTLEITIKTPSSSKSFTIEPFKRNIFQSFDNLITEIKITVQRTTTDEWLDWGKEKIGMFEKTPSIYTEENIDISVTREFEIRTHQGFLELHPITTKEELEQKESSRKNAESRKRQEEAERDIRDRAQWAAKQKAREEEEVQKREEAQQKKVAEEKAWFDSLDPYQKSVFEKVKHIKEETEKERQENMRPKKESFKETASQNQSEEPRKSSSEAAPSTSSSLKDAYEALQLSPDATLEDVKEAHRKFARLYHPDKQRSPEDKVTATEKFRKIQEAYELLSNSLEKK